ncbi:MAG: aspartate kinase [Bacteroidetes bacterium CG2_30_32_10]|nr:MAG: aspartate kinase [Bacteroidetes bacterium CG2_30_32_10]
MKVFKFGGASVKEANAVKNVANIINLFPKDNLLIVVSAMGKTTNALEKLNRSIYSNTNDIIAHIRTIKDYHYAIVNELFADKTHQVFNELAELFESLAKQTSCSPSENVDYSYDQIVSFGELIATKIISNYLQVVGIDNTWLDVREIIKTNTNYREGLVDWKLTNNLSQKQLLPAYNSYKERKIIVTQGFIAGTTEKTTTTLGREGSDYTASILAYQLNAEEVIIWKDVPGVLNADPKYFSVTEKLNAISYREAIELSYYGATIIHPKTIKPLQNKNIPLSVKSFIAPEDAGTLINNNTQSDSLIPSFIFKVNQLLISLMPKDFSFIAEDNLSKIFACFVKHHVKINLMQNSAISFSVCFDNIPEKAQALITELQQTYKIKYNEHLELITIRHFDQKTIDRVTQDKIILLEQKSRSTAQLVVKNKN